MNRNSDMISQLELERLKRKGSQRSVSMAYSGFYLLILGYMWWIMFSRFHGLRNCICTITSQLGTSYITATFCHFSWNHLSSNLFFLYILGKLVEEEEGNFALGLSYILTGAGANLVSWLILPRNAVSIGASGAVFGLFAVSVLMKVFWDWRKILEVLILGQFVVEKVMETAQASASLGGSFRGGYALQNVNHIAHLSAGLIGVVLIWLLSSVPSLTDEK